MGSTAPARYPYGDLLAMPEELVRREIIDGELSVSPSPSLRHQRAVTPRLLPGFALAVDRAVGAAGR